VLGEDPDLLRSRTFSSCVSRKWNTHAPLLYLSTLKARRSESLPPMQFRNSSVSFW
jgi:hypothetical protein